MKCVVNTVEAMRNQGLPRGETRRGMEIVSAICQEKLVSLFSTSTSLCAVKLDQHGSDGMQP